MEIWGRISGKELKKGKIDYQLGLILNYIRNFLMLSTRLGGSSLLRAIQYQKTEWKNCNPYNERWQYKWKHAYYTYPKDTYEATYTKKPQDLKPVNPPGFNYFQDVLMRIWPEAKCYLKRSRRWSDPFQLYLLPSISAFSLINWDVALGFKILTVFPLMMFYTRMRDRSQDPDIKETYLRDIIHQNAQVGQLFKPESIHVLDYELEYDEGYPDECQFPEYTNSRWRFFNRDAHMCTGFFKFGDVESGAVMTLHLKTMPVAGRWRFQVGEPFYYYDVRAQITHNGEFKQIQLVDPKKELKFKKPYLLWL